MELKRLVLGTATMLLVLATGRAHAQKQVPIWERDGHAQYEVTYRDLAKAVVIIDQYDDTKLKHDLGDAGAWWGFIDQCYATFRGTTRTEQIVLWALCRDDLKALDESTLTLEENRANVKEWKKLGAAIEAEAKDDPGVALILKQADAAKADWKAFEEKNHAAIVLYQKLKDGVRTSKSNDENFEGCWEATKPAFAKAVKATKFRWDNEGDDAVPGRVAEIIARDPANYYAVANFGMCAYAAHVTGGILAGAALRASGGVFGWRTMLIAKLLDPTFKPKFADRSYTWATGQNGTMYHLRGGNDGLIASFPWPGGPMAIETGVVKKMKKDGDDTLVVFTGTVVEDCLKWKETGKIRTWDTAGNPVYVRICTKRGRVVQDAPGDTTFGTKLTEGFAPGLGVAFYGSFPEEVYNDKKKKFVSILGVSVKGSPAQTPLKE